ncbi:MAG: phosphoesterase [Mogibacterium sp.]|nr:phosphoesterase [Mogibacterium sp.]
MQRITYDMHIHSCLSPCGDNESTPANIVGMAALIGLDAIAIADHNSCKNLPAAAKIAEEYGVILVPAMELTTMEEVHVLCYFHTVEKALEFSAYVEENSMYIENKVEFFGDQLIYDENDELVGTEPRLLHTASDFSFDDIYDILKPFDGLMVPAHINKATTSVLSNLGWIPEDSRFTAAEIQTVDKITELREQYPYLQKCHILSSSDAHYLQDIQEPIRYLHVEERSVDGILASLDHYL